MKLIKAHIIAAFFSVLVIASVFAAPASAAVGSANLKVTIVETNPYPAKIGEYLTLTVQVENVGGDKADDVDIEIVPEYPFSLDSTANAVQNIGALNPGRTATKEFYLYVDKNAQKGTRSIDIRARTGKDKPWSEKTIDIRIGTETFESKGTVELAEFVTSPEVFMPGDRGTITVTLKNTATATTVTIDDKDYDTNARIQAATLKPLSDGITNLEAPYYEMGLVGPGDSIQLTFNVKVEEDASEGTHNLELAIEGNSYDYSCRKNIPLKVDSSNIKVIPSKPLQMVDGQATVEFDVANTHPNELNSVSIKPEAEGVKFYPAEYFIGPMDSDELFTIEFDATVDDSSDVDTSEPINMNVTATYNNGINRHENVAGNLKLEPGFMPTETNSTVAIAGGVIAVFIPAAFLVYKKKKQ
ncbi:putative carboxyl-terminal-processing protease, deltaproteobacterial [Methanosarcina siciliae T4/M]|uniref:Putative carboxyl-terminal-processing protease, deltaproteobacterial n=2 Tax=Methanosarcina siciliae TaxID=38027 RepID=A0A0E3PIB3_9EURY|nr:COG1361 S-layer family protein [Methanosarcina siciliae]AKB30022.1 putative carboxyl-terminal-processing protease, deltaproteobacterial [Methanosarcina siciliae T4/M]AKB33922.1 putative carboxyl-terminal-processing protease, deltaproteobacterial [Methanosarcina siciliae HI350]